jgi:hypothetical protein
MALLQNLIKTDPATNIIEVREEADMGESISGVITLSVDKTVYKFIGDVYFSSRIVINPLISITFVTEGFATNRVIYTGTDTFITSAGVTRLTFHRLHFVSSTGTATLLNLSGLDAFFTIPTEFFYYDGIIEGFGGGVGAVTNIIASVWSQMEVLQCGKLVFDNGFGVSFNIMFFRNFYSTGEPFVEFLTNASQFEFTGVAFFPTKGDSPFFVDPAITDTSALSLGRVPYQGLVFGGILSFVDIGEGQVRVIVVGGISFEDNDYVTIIGTTNYNTAATQVTNVNPIFFSGTTPVGSFDITATFVADDATGQAFLLNSSLTGLEIVPFFEEGETGTITAYADNGAGGTTVTSAGHGQLDGKSLCISGDAEGDYDGGYEIFNTTTNTFDISATFVADDAQGEWNTGSLDTTNNVLPSANTGGIIPDSQSLGNNILTSTQAIALTTTLTEVLVGTWESDESERFKATNDGRLIYTGRSDVIVSISAKVVLQKQQGTTQTAFMNIMQKRVGETVFTEIPIHPSAQTQVQNSNASQLTVAALVENASTGDEFAIGLAADVNFTADIFSIDFNIKK